MRVWKVLWGLLVDDAWLAGGAVASILILFGWTSAMHRPAAAGWVFLACLLAAFAWSLFMEVRRRPQRGR
ncbi:hypothetical protein GCM10010885_24100 [Alicyclobacillus cellulosilyticus]|uniref:Uncharacterized protein n=1 Tax=Alicyclobacillus cellulosilyticus TaxID=1003997 RepID=A0A917KH45_9BACL|nr:hypothetical protein [Alicyclobacillus cellulosilyticus]GGJ13906.1 hypothetical protein GCM10010885_24100 [Alicyclobacillus cellulosilyticus]